MKITDLSGQVIVITGAAKGIGAAMARAFKEAAATVVLIDIDPDGAGLYEQLNGGAVFFQCDVSDQDAVSAVFARIGRQFGSVHVLVNNAGIQLSGKVGDMDIETWDRTMNVNLRSAFLCARHAIPLMQNGLTESGGGRVATPVIINMSSVQAFSCEENIAAYVVSKAGMLGLTRAIAVDYAPDIRCVAVCPGAVNTEMLRNDIGRSNDPAALMAATKSIHLLQRLAEPEEIAAFVLFLAGEGAAFCTGQYYRIDGGIGSKLSLL